MKVCLSGLGLLDQANVEFVKKFTELARQNPGPFTLVEKTSDADLILGIYGARTPGKVTEEQKKLLRERADDFYVFETSDLALLAYQGVYCVLGKSRGRNHRFRTYCFPMENNYIEEAYRETIEPDLFFSFLGGSTSWLRKRMYRLDFGRPDVIIRDTSYHQEWTAWSPEWEQNKRDYARLMARTKFVICPRGVTPTAGRMYEGMQMGRVIVVISDEYYPPEGPDWEKFMIRVPERDLPRLVEILTPYQDKWREMGKIARVEWEKWFAPNMWFQRIIENCVSISRTRRCPEASHLWKVPYLEVSQKVRLKTYGTLKNVARTILKTAGLAKKFRLNRA